MTTYYSVVQYVPDPVADERVNIGVVAYDEGRWMLAEPEDWRRAERFTGVSTAGLRAHVRDLRGMLDASDTPAACVRTMSAWRHSLQVTSPRVSLDSLDVTIEGCRNLLVSESHPGSRSAKPVLLRATRDGFRRALKEHGLGDVTERVLVNRREVNGAIEPHTVDLGLVNGHLLLGARALAFPARQSTYVRNEVTAAIWAAEDIRAAVDAPTFAVLIAPPADPKRPDYQRAMKVLTELNADVVHQDSVIGWAREQVGLFKGDLAGVAGTPSQPGG